MNKKLFNEHNITKINKNKYRSIEKVIKSKSEDNLTSEENVIVTFEKNGPKAMFYWYFAMFFELVGMVINKTGAFILPVAQVAFIAGQTTLSIILLIGYMLERVIFQINCYIRSRIRMNYDKLNKLDIDRKTNEIYNMTRGKVVLIEKLNGDEDKVLYRKMSNAEVVRSCFENINNARKKRDITVKSIIDIITTTIMLIGALYVGAKNVTNIPAFMFIALVSIVLSAYVSYKQGKRRKVFYKFSRDLSNKVAQEQFDLLNVKPINEQHKSFLIYNYIDSNSQLIDKTNIKDKKDLFDWLIYDVFTSISIVALVGVSMMETKVMNLETFTMLIALFTLYARVIEKTNTQVKDIQDIADAKIQHKISEELFEKIIKVYVNEKSRKINNKFKIRDIEIDNYEYIYYSEENKELYEYYIRAPHMSISIGETILLSGESGSGKSTFIRSLVGETDSDITTKCLRINNKGKYNKIINAILYDPETKMGCKTIYEEIILKDSYYEIEEDEKKKIINILTQLELSESIIDKTKNNDIIESIKLIHFDKFSIGQQQRLVLARLLYNLDDKIDIIFLDEPTANLDKHTSKNVMLFIKQFCNQDKKRAIIIASHDLDTMVKENIYDRWYNIGSDHIIVETNE